MALPRNEGLKKWLSDDNQLLTWVFHIVSHLPADYIKSSRNLPGNIQHFISEKFAQQPDLQAEALAHIAELFAAPEKLTAFIAGFKISDEVNFAYISQGLDVLFEAAAPAHLLQIKQFFYNYILTDVLDTELNIPLSAPYILHCWKLINYTAKPEPFVSNPIPLRSTQVVDIAHMVLDVFGLFPTLELQNRALAKLTTHKDFLQYVIEYDKYVRSEKKSFTEKISFVIGETIVPVTLTYTAPEVPPLSNSLMLLPDKGDSIGFAIIAKPVLLLQAGYENEFWDNFSPAVKQKLRESYQHDTDANIEKIFATAKKVLNTYIINKSFNMASSQTDATLLTKYRAKLSGENRKGLEHTAIYSRLLDRDTKDSPIRQLIIVCAMMTNANSKVLTGMLQEEIILAEAISNLMNKLAMIHGHSQHSFAAIKKDIIDPLNVKTNKGMEDVFGELQDELTKIAALEVAHARAMVPGLH